MNSAKWLIYIPIIFWTILIIYLSTGSSVQLPPNWWDIIGVDKIGHFVFYAIHAFLSVWTIDQSNTNRLQPNSWLIAFIGSSLLGILLEIVQFSYYPNRYFEILDIIANISGSFLGTVIYKKLKKHFLNE